MILIADAGATRIEWRLITEEGNIKKASTAGFNPYYQAKEELVQVMREAKEAIEVDKVGALFFYGAGISSDEKKEEVKAVLKTEIHADKYCIDHDLLASARALLMDKPGIACILGTGSNSCFYDGKNVISSIPSLGYAVGDEGSGAALGKRLMKAYLRNGLPENVKMIFEQEFRVKRSEFLKQVYQLEAPSKYLASFSKFLHNHLSDPFISNLVTEEFQLFFEEVVLQYEESKEFPVNFCGSVAFHYSKLIKEVAASNKIQVDTILESPITTLTWYHQEQNQL